MEASMAQTCQRYRDRVKGFGPDRSQLPNFKKVCDLPIKIQQQLLDVWRACRHNDLENSEKYPIKDNCSLKYTLPEGMKHILLQSINTTKDPNDEKSYSVWNELALATDLPGWIEKNIGATFRTRLAVLPPGAEFSWHIDTNTAVACRCSVILNNPNSVFEIDRKGQVETLKAEVGEVIFTNTGYKHRVYNPTKKTRCNLLFGFEYSELKNRGIELIK